MLLAHAFERPINQNQNPNNNVDSGSTATDSRRSRSSNTRLRLRRVALCRALHLLSLVVAAVRQRCEFDDLSVMFKELQSQQWREAHRFVSRLLLGEN